MKLYTYFRSSAAYRVRIALGLKGLDYEAVPVHLVRDGGEHRRPEYLDLNPAGLVPTLEDAGQVLTQSLAIIEYLDETHPQARLLPEGALDRARVPVCGLAIAIDCPARLPVAIARANRLARIRSSVCADPVARPMPR